MNVQIVTKSAEKKYTLMLMYSPDTPDAHNEFTRAGTLQEAMWKYVQSGDRSIHLQHGDSGIVKLGEWVDVVTWPFPHTAKFTKADGSTYEQEVPAGTVYMGVLWNETGWQLVKSGKLSGLSMGGTATRKSAPAATLKSGDLWLDGAGR